jgi:hypothetical protein
MIEYPNRPVPERPTYPDPFRRPMVPTTPITPVVPRPR